MKNKKKIKLLKVLAFPVSAWFMFNVGSMVVNAQEVEATPLTVETTDINNDESVQSMNQETEVVASTTSAATESVSYQTHVQDIGWQSEKEDGQTAGTTNESKRIEAIDIQVDSQYAGNVVYQAHVQDIGWQNEVSNGQQAGTTGQSKKVEAIRVWLTGDLANHYSIQYRTHVQNIGWQDWVSDGLLSGTTGQNLRLEAIQIKLVDLSQSKYDLLQYTTHVQNVGWQNQVTSGQTAGTTGQGLRVEGIRVYLNTSKYSGNITYQAHVQNIGWQNTVSNRELAGTENQSLRIEAIRFNLEGDIARYYDVVYRVHVSDYGWLDWASNGNIAGTTGHSKKLEAIEIKLVEKGTAVNTGGVSSIQNGVNYVDDQVLTGWTTVDGKKYYYNSKGEKVTGYQTIDGNKYCFRSDGTLITNGWTGTEVTDCNYADANGVVTISHLWAINSKTEYVVDQEAYDSVEPVYKYEVHNLCNECREDFHGWTQAEVTAHCKNHALNGDKHSGYHTEMVKVFKGYETVHHKEVGHNEETILSKHCLRCGATE